LIIYINIYGSLEFIRIDFKLMVHIFYSIAIFFIIFLKRKKIFKNKMDCCSDMAYFKQGNNYDDDSEDEVDTNILRIDFSILKDGIKNVH